MQRASFRLLTKANKALQNRNIKKATQIADRLIARQYSGGYEIKARSLEMNRQTEEAIAVLEEGVRKFPGVFILWSYLGEYCSNVERYQDALAAFHQCEMAGDDPSYSRLNIAIVYARMNDANTALQFLDGLEPRNPENERAILMVHAWTSLLKEDWELALEQSRDSGQRFPDCWFFAAYEAYALMRSGQPQMALKRAWEVVEANESIDYALDVIRELTGKASNNPKRFLITIDGELEFKKRNAPRGYFQFCRMYCVQAETPEEALEYIRPFEKDAAIPITIRDSEVLEHECEGRDGVCKFRPDYYLRRARRQRGS